MEAEQGLATGDLAPLEQESSEEVPIWDAANHQHSFSLSERRHEIADEEISDIVAEEALDQMPRVKISLEAFPKREVSIIKKTWPQFEETLRWISTFLELHRPTPGILSEKTAAAITPKPRRAVSVPRRFSSARNMEATNFTESLKTERDNNTPLPSRAAAKLKSLQLQADPGFQYAQHQLETAALRSQINALTAQLDGLQNLGVRLGDLEARQIELEKRVEYEHERAEKSEANLKEKEEAWEQERDLLTKKGEAANLRYSMLLERAEEMERDFKLKEGALLVRVEELERECIKKEQELQLRSDEDRRGTGRSVRDELCSVGGRSESSFDDSRRKI